MSQPPPLHEAVAIGSLPAAMQALDSMQQNGEAWQVEQQQLTQTPSTLGFWVLAEMTYREGDIGKAARWAHLALLATRMDAAMCLHKRADELEFHLMKAFPAMVRDVRSDPFLVNEALMWVRDHHAQWVTENEGSQWLCKVANEAFPENAARGIAPAHRREQQRQRASEKYFKQAFPGR